VARAIHTASARSDKPFVAVNCAAFTETLLESELFGHEKGAFTGADRSRQGLFEAAHLGTLFLDEAGELSQAAQAKLLRVLMDGQLMRVGSTKPRTVDVRVIVATHRDLAARVRDGVFREDLYYRLAVVPVHLAPLRERREDIAVLAEMFARQIATDLKKPTGTIRADAIELLTRYRFPGNVRELRNLIERAYILTDDPPLGPDSFMMPSEESAYTETGASPSTGTGPGQLPDRVNLPEYLDGIEKALIERILEAAGGRQAEAARRLSISRGVLSYKLTKFGIRSVGD
jgi:transcriptional regulator with GAF, ATPase, and Fis domain